MRETTGILDSLETRNREAVANKIPYTDFLALLIADEIARREHKKFNLRIRRAGFRSSKTIEQFDFDFNVAINQTLITELATCRFVAEKVAVLIAGPCGTGKSHIAQALGHAAVRADYDVLFTTQSQLLASLQCRARHQRLRATLPHLCSRAAARHRRLRSETPCERLRTRTSTTSLPSATNRAPPSSPLTSTSLSGATPSPNRLLGAATLDRLRHGAYRLTLEGESYRSPRPMPEPRKPTIATGGSAARLAAALAGESPVGVILSLTP